MALIAHVLGFGFNEILDLSLDEFKGFLNISKEILKAKSGVLG
ncbi:hypothetical protein [Campylobacter sp. 7477a]